MRMTAEVASIVVKLDAEPATGVDESSGFNLRRRVLPVNADTVKAQVLEQIDANTSESLAVDCRAYKCSGKIMSISPTADTKQRLLVAVAFLVKV